MGFHTEFRVNISLGVEAWHGKLHLGRVLCELLGGGRLVRGTRLGVGHLAVVACYVVFRCRHVSRVCLVML